VSVRSPFMAKREYTMLEAAGREVRLSNPAKVYFPKPGWTKLEIANYYLAVADAALVHLSERPTVMKRFVNGIMEEPIWQKRVPRTVPDWLQTATVAFPSGRTAAPPGWSGRRCAASRWWFAMCSPITGCAATRRLPGRRAST
jgi:hypothetical protein